MKKLLVGIFVVVFALCIMDTSIYAKDKNEDAEQNTTVVQVGNSQDADSNSGTSSQTDDPEYWKYIKAQDKNSSMSDSKDTGENSVSRIELSSSPSDGYVHNSKFANATVKNVIDVSSFQGDIDWGAVKNSGVDFVFIRVGYRGYGSGTLNIDSNAQKNLQAAEQAGLKIGVYFFSQAISEDEAKQEADYEIQQLGNISVSLPVVMDFEYASDQNGLTGRMYDAHLDSTKNTNIINAFVAEVKNKGYEPMVYANKSMLQNNINASDLTCKVWLANYTTQTDYAGDYQFWQYRSDGSINGISGNVDCDFWYDIENGWSTENGKKYYYKNGVMAKNQEIYDASTSGWYWVGQDGAMAKGFQTIPDGTTEGKEVYYDETTGVMHHGESYINGGWYWFDNNTGAMAKGFLNIPDGTTEGKEVYYDETTGVMHHGESYINGGWYWFDNNTGAMTKGFLNIPDGTAEGKEVYYDETTGVMHHGEGYINGGWYWFDNNTGAMAKGFLNIPDGTADGKWVYYDESTGVMHHGESYINGGWYRFDDETGKMVHGEYCDANENWYYYDQSTGIMAHGWTTLPNGSTYHYDEETGIRVE